MAIATAKKDSIKEFANYSKSSGTPAATEAPAQTAPTTTAAPATPTAPLADLPPTSTGGRVLASPLAKATAQQHNISLDGI